MTSLLFFLWACDTPETVPGFEPVAAASSVALPYYDSPDFTPRWLSHVPDSFHRIGAFSLTDQHGEAVTQETIRGRPVVASFFFTSCGGICPDLTASMARVDEAAPDQVVLLSHSVTPDKDTVPVLRGFAKKHGITSDRWHLLTGSREVIYALGREGYFVEQGAGLGRGPDDFLHAESLVLVDADGHLRGVYNGLNATAVDQLIEDLDLLAKSSP